MKNFSSKARFTVKILAIAFLSLPLMGACRQVESELNSCLPESRQLTDIVSVEGFASNVEEASKLKRVTISEKLAELQARCDNDLLVDSQGKEIRFFDLQFCGGPNPPEEMVREYREELEALEDKYTVIGMTCNPDGIPYP
ncbi:hypothetical protein NIES267_57160 [Calothrix parasitica NIES-267]|uniref:Lipoprotein n=1 Tax=Calothrix parasitica NIES-267 TaxID=1973488 RepID=A0A1Z4LYB6_9CYAN|nr:hypothetical protein NIES267_57160 [Calothrix parasitica NIES-267]